jgi:hypothetical protein
MESERIDLEAGHDVDDKLKKWNPLTKCEMKETANERTST